MPISTPSALTILPPAQSSPGSVKHNAQHLLTGSGQSSDQKLWTTTAEALANLQRQVDRVYNLLRTALPIPDTLILTDNTGAVTGGIGDLTDFFGEESFPGALWMKTILVGGTGPASASPVGPAGLQDPGANGIVKRTALDVTTVAVAGTDYAAPPSGTAILYGNGSGGFSNVTVGSGLTFSSGTLASTAGGGSVTTVSVVSANGLAGTVANPTTTPAITLSTTITGILKGNSTAISAAVAGTDYVIPSAIANLAAFSAVTTPANSLGTIYQNTTGRPVFVSVYVLSSTLNEIVSLKCGSSSPPTVVMTADSNAQSGSTYLNVQFVVPPNYYYEVTVSATATLAGWAQVG